MQHRPSLKSPSYPQRLADECRLLASRAENSALAAIFGKLAQLFEEATALYVRDMAPQSDPTDPSRLPG
jgi:hypothetical protein